MPGKQKRIEVLVRIFEQDGNLHHECPGDRSIRFTADTWNDYSYEEQQQILMQYRLGYLAYAEVNWCPALGTVLANDEVVNGVSERGGHPVIKKKCASGSSASPSMPTACCRASRPYSTAKP